MTDPIIDVGVVEEETEVSRAIAVSSAPVSGPALAVVPQVSPKDLVARLDAIKETQRLAMQENVDYGVIPGTDKPTLFKPGAEKLAALFQLDVQPQNEKRWEADNHLTVVSRVTIFYAPTGARLGSGEGVCTTREKKYAYRQQDRTCPKCEAATIKRSKYPPRNNPQAEPGWYCFEKIGGCGANFAADDEAITRQTAGQVDNPDLPDLWNVVDKMATKRALVAAVLIVTGASAVFTQDLEDMTEAARRNGAATQAEMTQERGPSQKQREYLDRLIGERYGEDASLVRGLAAKLDSSQVSRAIGGLKDGDAEIQAQLLAEAKAWDTKQSEVPADEDGLSADADPEDEGTPF